MYLKSVSGWRTFCSRFPLTRLERRSLCTSNRARPPGQIFCAFSLQATSLQVVVYLISWSRRLSFRCRKEQICRIEQKLNWGAANSQKWNLSKKHFLVHPPKKLNKAIKHNFHVSEIFSLCTSNQFPAGAHFVHVFL